MRRLINKGNEREDLMKTVENVFKEGWRLIKFYYMCGLPMELDSDLAGIAEEAIQAWEIGRQHMRHPEINVSVSSFVPKPFTPFQWEPQCSIEEIVRRHAHIRRLLPRGGIKFKHHGVEMSYLEGVFSRGDRRLSKTLLRAYELGCRFDEWNEQLDFPKWMQAFQETGIDPDFYVTRRRERGEVLPWDHLFIQMKKDFLWEELTAAHDLAFVDDCSFGKCVDCGICDFRRVKNVNYQYSPAESKVTAYSTRRRILKDEAPQFLTNPVSEFAGKAPPIPSKIKIRAQFTKLGDAAYLSHLDLATLIRRAMLRAELPVGYSQGFHPMMKLSLGPALPVGVESSAEYLDVELTEVMAPKDFTQRINLALPEGIALLRSWIVAVNGRSLNSALREQSYQIEVPDQASHGSGGDLEKRVRDLRDSSEVRIERRRPKKTQTVDIRPFIKDLEVVAPNLLHLTTYFGQTSGSIKPTEVLQALNPEDPRAFAGSRIKKVESVFEPGWLEANG